MSRLLIIDDDVASCRTLQLHFSGQGHQVDLAHTVDDGLSVARENPPDVIVLDIRMPGRSGLEGLPEFKAVGSDVPVIMITAYHDMDSTIQAMKRGADDYIHKPVDIDELDQAVATALLRVRSDDREMPLGAAEGRDRAGTMVGRSRQMKEVFKIIGRVAPKPVTVLITGESGTGKELVARAIHRAGQNPDGPFVAVNCAALVETLLESELFGHEKGAFTGAVSRQPGKFAMANDGTIFLDEIGELSHVVQAKLLRVLQEREYLPVGGNQVHTTTARVVAATNVDLLERVHAGVFREDLYYRLKVVNLHLPPLREHPEDVFDLVEALLARINRDMPRKVGRVSMDVMDVLHRYAWPGNVRELENVLMKAVALCPGDTLTLDLLPPEIRGDDVAPRQEGVAAAGMSLDDVQREHIGRVLATTGWHRGRACEILGISRPRLRRLIAQYGLTPPDDVVDTDGDDN